MRKLNSASVAGVGGFGRLFGIAVSAPRPSAPASASSTGLEPGRASTSTSPARSTSARRHGRAPRRCRSRRDRAARRARRRRTPTPRRDRSAVRHRGSPVSGSRCAIDARDLARDLHVHRARRLQHPHQLREVEANGERETRSHLGNVAHCASLWTMVRGHVVAVTGVSGFLGQRLLPLLDASPTSTASSDSTCATRPAAPAS